MNQNYEQLVTVYHRVFVYCGIAAILFLLIAVALFFFLKIPLVFDELTGRPHKKQSKTEELPSELPPIEKNAATVLTFRIVKSIVVVHTKEVI